MPLFYLLRAFTLAVTVAIAHFVFADDRPRLIVLADMGNEPDEEQQMLHLLVCSNELQPEGLIAVTGKFLHPDRIEERRRKLYPELLRQLIDGYERVYPNLQKHATGYHDPDYLRGIVATGQVGYGIAGIREGKSSPGSELIIQSVTRDDPRPVHVVVNAGSNTLAQALYDFRANHSKEQTLAFVRKLRVFEIKRRTTPVPGSARSFRRSTGFVAFTRQSATEAPPTAISDRLSGNLTTTARKAKTTGRTTTFGRVTAPSANSTPRASSDTITISRVAARSLGCA